MTPARSTNNPWLAITLLCAAYRTITTHSFVTSPWSFVSLCGTTPILKSCSRRHSCLITDRILCYSTAAFISFISETLLQSQWLQNNPNRSIIIHLAVSFVVSADQSFFFVNQSSQTFCRHSAWVTPVLPWRSKILHFCDLYSFLTQLKQFLYHGQQLLIVNFLSCILIQLITSKAINVTLLHSFDQNIRPIYHGKIFMCTLTFFTPMMIGLS